MADAIPGYDGDSVWFNNAKYEPAQINIAPVVRERLIERLDDLYRRKLALVVAPAGFGKSTLLAQWHDVQVNKGHICAWLTLDSNEAEPNQFLASLAIALSHAGADISELEIGARNGFPDSPVRLVLDNLLRRINAMDVPCVIILDDYHLAESSSVDAILKQFLREAPNGFSIVINSRCHPAIDAPVLLASGAALEVGPDQLRFTQEETVAALGRDISAADAMEIYRETEGWPVAVQLARVQKQARPSSSLSIASAGGVVGSYLTDQVLATLDHDCRKFLLTVSVLDRFNPDLANAIGQCSNSRELLERLQSLVAFLIPLDHDLEWYRLHYLFAEYLRETLLKEEPGKFEEIARHASAWHAARGELVEAVKYAAKAGATEECERLILAAGGWKVVLTDGIGVLRSLLRYLPDSFVSTRPRLLIAKAYLCCKDGQQRAARRLFDAAVGLTGRHEDTGLERDLLVCGSMLNSYEDRKDWADLIDDDKLSQAFLDTLQPLEAGTLKCEAVMFCFAQGDFANANVALQSAFLYIRRSGSLIGLNYCYLHAAIAALHLADFDVARTNIVRAMELSEDNFGVDSGLTHLALVLDYALRVWTGQANADEVDSFFQTLSQIEELDGWTDIYLIGLDAAYHYGSQIRNFDFAGEVADRFMGVARAKNLDRLETCAMIFKMMTAWALRDEYNGLLLGEKVTKWMQENSPGKQARSWQGYFLSVAAVATGARPVAPDIEVHLEDAIAHADAMGAALHSVRLRVARALYRSNVGDTEQGKVELLKAISIANPNRVFGPFMVDGRLRDLLRELRSDLRSVDTEQLVYGFIIETLKKLDVLQPVRPKINLSRREQDIMEQLARGFSNKEIARVVELTDNTVKFHVRNIFTKLSVHRRAQAVVKAREYGLID
ncbi:MAG: LuxR C-terminal-related transcriptional regulator [Gammaproteobacteria bacterium]|nr:LuxR C-terminal-related transcriptional regulator [Gammaproteobacteria bacterium]MCY4282950.1 LuxR C-terminal-related transcriptional regulator [Gammaproteobacteria bacterium]MCY4337838.1 LuxR C-terminal-related transcriptional regulator [Gammaproteobacteria bacterium]